MSSDLTRIVALPKWMIIIQGRDQYFCEMQDEWLPVPAHSIGLWGDEYFGPHVHMRGFASRLSDSTHPDRFLAKYGREKPARLVDIDICTTYHEDDYDDRD